MKTWNKSTVYLILVSLKIFKIGEQYNFLWEFCAIDLGRGWELLYIPHPFFSIDVLEQNGQNK